MSLSDLVKNVSQELLTHNIKLVTAESCTGGQIAKLITDLAGSSAIFERGYITYSNQAKIDLLAVSQTTLDKYGAVSAQTAEEMAQGALVDSQSHIALSVTGIAGPGGGSEEKPVGLVYIGIAYKGHVSSYECHFNGTRENIRDQTSHKALEIIQAILKNSASKQDK